MEQMLRHSGRMHMRWGLTGVRPCPSLCRTAQPVDHRRIVLNSSSASNISRPYNPGMEVLGGHPAAQHRAGTAGDRTTSACGTDSSGISTTHIAPLESSSRSTGSDSDIDLSPGNDLSGRQRKRGSRSGAAGHASAAPADAGSADAVPHAPSPASPPASPEPAFSLVGPSSTTADNLPEAFGPSRSPHLSATTAHGEPSSPNPDASPDAGPNAVLPAASESQPLSETAQHLGPSQPPEASQPLEPPQPPHHQPPHKQAPHPRQPGRLRTVTRLLPRVLFLHTGGTLGMDPEEAFEEDEGHNLRVRAGATESSYKGSLRPGEMLSSLLTMVPELDRFANVDLQVLFNKDSSRVGPSDWIHIAQALDHQRPHYDAFIVVHGTDTLAYTAAALSLMLPGFKKPIVLTGSQLPLRAPRTDARQNLLDSIQVATSAFSPPHVALQEVAVCFGGKLMRGNRTQKVNSAAYQAFDSPGYPYLATLGIDVDWNTRVMLRPDGAYKPRFKLDPRVIRVPVVPGSDPRVAYGDLYGRGVRGVVLEAFGVGNLPDQSSFGWLPWLRDQTAKGLQVCLISQCALGPLQPALYRAGQLAAAMGVEPGPQMTPECAVVKLMFCLEHPDLALGVPLAGEL